MCSARIRRPTTRESRVRRTAREDMATASCSAELLVATSFYIVGSDPKDGRQPKDAPSEEKHEDERASKDRLTHAKQRSPIRRSGVSRYAVSPRSIGGGVVSNKESYAANCFPIRTNDIIWERRRRNDRPRIDCGARSLAFGPPYIGRRVHRSVLTRPLPSEAGSFGSDRRSFASG
jgi:hypothetical protein